MLFLDLFLHFFLVGLNAAITYSRAWRIQGAAPKTAHSHTRPVSVSAHSGLPTTRNTHTLELRTFHPFTHENSRVSLRDELSKFYNKELSIELPKERKSQII